MPYQSIKKPAGPTLPAPAQAPAGPEGSLTGDIIKNMLGTGVRIAGPILGGAAGLLGGPFAGATVPLGAAAGGGLGEMVAEKFLDPGDHKINPLKVGIQSALGAVPGSWIIKAGKPVASGVIGAGLGYAQTAGNKLAEGESANDSLNPTQWSGTDFLGPVLGGLGGAAFGHIHGSKTPKAPPPPKPPSEAELMGYISELDKKGRGATDIVQKHAAIDAHTMKDPHGQVALRIWPKGRPDVTNGKPVDAPTLTKDKIQTKAIESDVRAKDLADKRQMQVWEEEASNINAALAHENESFQRAIKQKYDLMDAEKAAERERVLAYDAAKAEDAKRTKLNQKEAADEFKLHADNFEEAARTKAKELIAAKKDINETAKALAETDPKRIVEKAVETAHPKALEANAKVDQARAKQKMADATQEAKNLNAGEKYQANQDKALLREKRQLQKDFTGSVNAKNTRMDKFAKSRREIEIARDKADTENQARTDRSVKQSMAEWQQEAKNENIREKTQAELDRQDLIDQQKVGKEPVISNPTESITGRPGAGENGGTDRMTVRFAEPPPPEGEEGGAGGGGLGPSGVGPKKAPLLYRGKPFEPGVTKFGNKGEATKFMRDNNLHPDDWNGFPVENTDENVESKGQYIVREKRTPFAQAPKDVQQSILDEAGLNDSVEPDGPVDLDFPTDEEPPPANPVPNGGPKPKGKGPTGGVAKSLERNRPWNQLTTKEQDALTKHLIDAQEGGFNGDMEALGDELAGRYLAHKDGFDLMNDTGNGAEVLMNRIKLAGGLYDDGSTEITNLKQLFGRKASSYFKKTGVHNGPKGPKDFDLMLQHLQQDGKFGHLKTWQDLQAAVEDAGRTDPTKSILDDFSGKVPGGWWEPKGPGGVGAEVTDYTGGDIPTTDVEPPQGGAKPQAPPSGRSLMPDNPAVEDIIDRLAGGADKPSPPNSVVEATIGRPDAQINPEPQSPLTVGEFAGALDKQGQTPIGKVPFQSGPIAGGDMTGSPLFGGDESGDLFNPQPEGEPQVPEPPAQPSAAFPARFFNSRLDHLNDPEVGYPATQAAEKAGQGAPKTDPFLPVDSRGRPQTPARTQGAEKFKLGQEMQVNNDVAAQSGALDALNDPDIPDSVKARLKKNLMNQKGAISPMVGLRIATGLGGAAVGATQTPDDPLKGAIFGGVAGLAAPSLIKAGIQAFAKNPNAASSAQTEKLAGGIKGWAAKAGEVIPELQRFNLLADFPNLPINVIVGPFGSAFMSGLERAAQGDKRGLQLIKELFKPGRFSKEVLNNAFNEAKLHIADASERTEGQMGQIGPEWLRKITSAPGELMTAGDYAVRNIITDVGFSPEEARLMTLTAEPQTGFGRMVANAKKGAVTKGLKGSGPKGGKRSVLAQLMLPFYRTGVNQMERSAERTPFLGILAQRAKDVPDPIKAQLVQQGLGTVVETGAFALGTQFSDADPTNPGFKAMRKMMNEFAGPYGTGVSLAFTMGMAYGRTGDPIKAVGSGLGRLATGDMPLPTPQPLTDAFRTVKTLVEDGEFEPPAGTFPGMLDWRKPNSIPGAISYLMSDSDSSSKRPTAPPKPTAGPGKNYKRPAKPKVSK